MMRASVINSLLWRTLFQSWEKKKAVQKAGLPIPPDWRLCQSPRVSVLPVIHPFRSVITDGGILRGVLAGTKKTKKEKPKAKSNSDSPRGQDHNSDPRNTFAAWTIGPGQECQRDTSTRSLAGRPWWGWGSALPCRGTLSFAVESYILPVSTL